MDNEKMNHENESWYDAEIAPALAELARRCHERGMAFVASVEFMPNRRGTTVYMTEHAGLAMQMQCMCAETAPNMDAYVLSVLRYCKDQGLDYGDTFVLRDIMSYADLSPEQRAEFDGCGCEEGYSWFLTNVLGVVVPDDEDPGDYYAHLEAYHAWLGA